MKDQNRHWWLYVLKLENDKWYVGITSKTPEIRMHEHINGIRVAYWTAKYKPTELALEEDLGQVSKNQAEKYENKITRQLMRQHGLNNVRGGDLTSTEEYIVFFGYIYMKAQSQLILVLIFMLFTILYLLVDKLLFRR